MKLMKLIGVGRIMYNQEFLASLYPPDVIWTLLEWIRAKMTSPAVPRCHDHACLFHDSNKCTEVLTGVVCLPNETA
jgi:hypothetical protein